MVLTGDRWTRSLLGPPFVLLDGAVGERVLEHLACNSDDFVAVKNLTDRLLVRFRLVDFHPVAGFAGQVAHIAPIRSVVNILSIVYFKGKTLKYMNPVE